jgi:hypothetical protein
MKAREERKEPEDQVLLENARGPEGEKEPENPGGLEEMPYNESEDAGGPEEIHDKESVLVETNQPGETIGP